MMLWSVIPKNELFMFLGVGIFQLMLTYGRQIAEWFTISALVAGAGGNSMDFEITKTWACRLREKVIRAFWSYRWVGLPLILAVPPSLPGSA